MLNHLRGFLMRILPFVIVISLLSQDLCAWGERGHDLITQIAVERLEEKTDSRADLNRPFLLKTHMLAHLSNVPDIVWRGNYVDKRARTLNAPTHYFDLDYLYDNPVSLDDIETDFSKSQLLAKEKNLKLQSVVGTAAWRVLQLQSEMRDALAKAKASDKRAEFIRHTNQALLYAGIMSHFVGDLANPMHTTKDFDGWMTGNGGLHAYFESAIVSAYPPGLNVSVFMKTRESVLKNTLVSQYGSERTEKILRNPDQLIWSLILDSHQNLGRLTELDNQHSLIKRSKGTNSVAGGLRTEAERKPPATVTKPYENLIIERLAIGAETLAQLWLLAWESAGEPDLSGYQSFWYPVKPDFIEPDYLN